MSKQARVQSREVRKAHSAMAERRGSRRKWFATGGAAIILGLLVAIVVSLVNAAGTQNSADGTVSPDTVVTPGTATPNGALAVGDAAAPVRLEVYLDYMCPYCGRFERANGDVMDRMVADGTIRLELYPLSFLDKASSGASYSTRAANAITTVADRSPDKVLAVNRALFARQPAEGTRGLSDDEIATLAHQVGVSREVVDAFTERIFSPWVAASTTAVFKTGVSSTPTVKVNGKNFNGDLYNVGPLTQAIMSAKSQR